MITLRSWYQRLRDLATDMSLQGQLRRILFFGYVFMVAITACAMYFVWVYAAERKPIAATICALAVTAVHARSWYVAGKQQGKLEAEGGHE